METKFILKERIKWKEEYLCGILVSKVIVDYVPYADELIIEVLG